MEIMLYYIRSHMSLSVILIHFSFVSLQACLSAVENRGLKIGKAMYRELTGLKKPMLDKNNILHWPVLLLYAEAMTSDFVEDFCETDMFATHLDMISFFQSPFLFLFLHLFSITSTGYLFSMHFLSLLSALNMFSEDSPLLPWDKNKDYSREVIELYYEVINYSYSTHKSFLYKKFLCKVFLRYVATVFAVKYFKLAILCLMSTSQFLHMAFVLTTEISKRVCFLYS